jgi:hypothetical protein
LRIAGNNARDSSAAEIHVEFRGQVFRRDVGERFGACPAGVRDHRGRRARLADRRAYAVKRVLVQKVEMVGFGDAGRRQIRARSVAGNDPGIAITKRFHQRGTHTAARAGHDHTSAREIDHVSPRRFLLFAARQPANWRPFRFLGKQDANNLVTKQYKIAKRVAFQHSL